MEVFLALKPVLDDMPMSGLEVGMCQVRWLYDGSLINRFIKGGWHVYRCNGFQRVTEVALDIKMEKQDAETQCP